MAGIEIGENALWLPGRGHTLNEAYPIPSSEELQAHWSEYLGKGHIVAPAPGVLGVVRTLAETERPTAFASVDLCEVVRATCVACRGVEKPVEVIKNIHGYGDDLSISNDVETGLQVLMTNGLVPPVEGIEEIAEIMRRWRKLGVYVVANTSTLPGCERGTIEFFKRHLRGAIDGLLLPRNYDGTLPLTKGVAARNLLGKLGIGAAEAEPTPTVAIHIDDTSHHNIGFRDALAAMPGVQTRTFQPVYPSKKKVDEGSVLVATPLGAFYHADEFLTEQVPLPERPESEFLQYEFLRLAKMKK
jgi:hypothetical protein